MTAAGRLAGVRGRARSARALLTRAQLRASPHVKRALEIAAPVLDRVKPVWATVTDAGRVVLLFGVVSWAAGAYFDWNELMVVAAACVLVVAGASAFTLGHTSLEVALSVDPQRVTVGEPAVGKVDIVNHGRRQVIASQVEVPVGKGGVAHIDAPPLGNGEAFTDGFVIPTQRRSVVRVGPVRSVRGDPLGLLRRVVDWTGYVDLYVHPRVVVLPPPAAGWLRDLEGLTTNDLSPSDVAFHTLREYVPGDEPRNIHWRSSARMNKLMVRQFVDTRRAHVGLVLSTNPDDYATDGEFELAVSVVASVGRSALASEQNATCIAGAGRLPAYSPGALLDGLAGVELTSNAAADVASVVRRARRDLQTASVGIVVVGSRVSPAQLRTATSWLPASLRVLAVRIDEAATESSVRVIGSAQIATVRSLDDLAPRLAGLAQR